MLLFDVELQKKCALSNCDMTVAMVTSQVCFFMTDLYEVIFFLMKEKKNIKSCAPSITQSLLNMKARLRSPTKMPLFTLFRHCVIFQNAFVWRSHTHCRSPVRISETVRTAGQRCPSLLQMKRPISCQFWFSCTFKKEGQNQFIFASSITECKPGAV